LFIEVSQISCIEAGVLKNLLVNSIPNFLEKRGDALLAELRWSSPEQYPWPNCFFWFLFVFFFLFTADRKSFCTIHSTGYL